MVEESRLGRRRRRTGGRALSGSQAAAKTKTNRKAEMSTAKAFMDLASPGVL